jgi:hypothetical protein
MDRLPAQGTTQMENGNQDPRRFVNRSNPTVIVELIGEAQLRLAEIKQPVVVYSRGDNIYVRLSIEFHAKFKPYDQEN